ncbi:hypothetical protein [Nannocystis pusilla]|uniref:Uncharacterized protein n=1 Tax=Nannocystis pusilla TaxID=889268 RepID=A0ABS7TJV0_9BACT|nr:hypothetical protein [Nannocystis pusilla]MBZ5708505.1 hypothetical protein [Nannocystis pusilla]
MSHKIVVALSVLAVALPAAGCSDDTVTTDSTDAPGTTAGPSTGTTADAPPTSSSGAATETATTGDDTTTSGALPTTTTGATSTGEATTTTTTTASTGETTDTGVAGACDDGVAWVRHIAGATQTNMFNDLAIDAEDNAIAVGHFYERETDFGGGNLNFEGYDDAFIAKYGPDGEHLWSQSFGDEDAQELYGVAVDGDGRIVVAGEFRSTIDMGGGTLTSVGKDDIVLAAFSPAGEHLWSRSFGSPKIDTGVRVALDADGDIVLLARSKAPVDFGAGPQGDALNVVHVVKFDPAGALLWHRSFSSGDIDGHDVAVDPVGDIVVVGEFSGTVDFGGGPEASEDLSNVYVVKLDADGQFLWMRRSGGFAVDGKAFVVGAKTDLDGNINLAGWFGGSFDLGGPPLVWLGGYDLWIASLTATGEHRWSDRYGAGTKGWQFASDVAGNDAGQFALAGNFEDWMQFTSGTVSAQWDWAYDAWLGRFGPDGVDDHVRSFGGPGNQHGDVVGINDDGSIWLGGVFNAPFMAGDELLEPSDTWQGYLLRLCP